MFRRFRRFRSPWARCCGRGGRWFPRGLFASHPPPRFVCVWGCFVGVVWVWRLPPFHLCFLGLLCLGRFRSRGWRIVPVVHGAWLSGPSVCHRHSVQAALCPQHLVLVVRQRSAASTGCWLFFPLSGTLRHVIVCLPRKGGRASWHAHRMPLLGGFLGGRASRHAHRMPPLGVCGMSGVGPCLNGDRQLSRG